MNIIYTIISFVFVIGLIIISHEGGHYLVARANGIHVVEFMVGIGPRLFHFKRHGTEYSLRLLPFGGACIFENPDELDEQEKKKHEEKLAEDLVEDRNSSAFNDAPVFARIATVVAGPLFNIILAYFLALFIVFFWGETGTTISSVNEGYPAAEAGLKAGDVITKVNGERVYLFTEIQFLSYIDNHETWEIEYKRGEETFTTVLKPVFVTKDRRIIGITTNDFIECNNFSVFKYSFLEVRLWLKATFKSLKMLFTGRLTKDDLSGPVGIAKVTYDTIESTKEYGAFTVISNVINIALLLSVNLGIMNLLPLPVLDGGKLVFLLYELVTKKKPPQKLELIVQSIGVVLIIGLSIFLIINDTTKWFR